MMDLLSIDSLAVHDFTKYSVKRQDLDGEDSSRSETGYLSRQRIRAGVVTIEVSVTLYTSTQMNELVSALTNEVLETTYFFVQYYTTQTYSSNQTIDLKTAPDGTAYWDISFNLIEY